MATTRPATGPTTGPASFEIVVPARNEADRLPAGLAALCRKAATLPLRTAILVVDSASTDATGHIVRKWSAGPVPVRLLRCRQPGKGIAVRAGLLATSAPFVGYCDADMATSLDAMDTALRLLAAGYGAVIGSRAHHASEVEDRRSPARKVGAAVFRTLARGIVPGVTDTQCGFKFFSGPLARAAALPLRTAGFAFDIELIANCLRLGATLTEIPVRWRDVPGSTFSVRRHSTSAFCDMACIWLRSRILADGRPPAGGDLPLTRQDLPLTRQDLPLTRQDLPLTRRIYRLPAGNCRRPTWDDSRPEPRRHDRA